MSQQKTDLTIEELLDTDLNAYYAEKQLRKDRPWTYDIIRVLWGGWRSMDQLTRQLWEIRNPSGLPMPKKFRETIQSMLNMHTSQSKRWDGRIENDLFYSPEGKGSGTWAVHRERAAAWLKAKKLPDA